MNWPGRALWPLVLLSACAGDKRVEVRPSSLGELPEPVTAEPPISESPPAAQQLSSPKIRFTHISSYDLTEFDTRVARTSPEAVHEAVSAIYDARDGRYQWSDGLTLYPAADEILSLLGDAENHGLPARALRRFSLQRVRASLQWNQGMLDATEPHDAQFVPVVKLRGLLLAELDVQLTASALALSRMLGAYKLSGSELATIFPRATELADWTEGLVPWIPQYHRLVRAMARYRRYASEWRRWPQVALPESVTRMGYRGRGPPIAQLRARLRAEGLISGPAGRMGEDYFDATLREDLKVFQYTRGLPRSGLLDHATTDTLNESPAALVGRLHRALRQWRDSPTRRELTTIVVNIPEFTVELYRDQQRERRHLATIGYPYDSGGGRTKLFHTKVDHVVFNPGWTPSDTLLNDRLLKHESRTPGWLHQQGFRWFTRPDGRRGVYQMPGDRNTLGRVTIRFPNDNNIYLHGTPEPEQFQLPVRASSSGCVRVQDVEALALDLVTTDGSMSADELHEALKSTKTREVWLKEPLPIHFEYVRVVVDDDGTVRFLPNIYRR